MATYYATARSNYFQVKDIKAFQDAMDEHNVEVWVQEPTESTEPVLVGVTPEDSDGWPSVVFNEITQECEDVDFFSLVASHLVEGSVAIFMEVGAEKLRYVLGYAHAINSAGQSVNVSLNDIYTAAKTLGTSITDASY